MPAIVPDTPARPAVPAPGRSRIAAAIVAVALVPVACWLSAAGAWQDAGWLVPVLVVAAIAVGVGFSRAGVKAGGPVALTAVAVFAVSMSLFTTILFAVDGDVVRTLIAAVPAVVLTAFAAPGIQQGAADVDGEWIVAAGVAILALFVSMLLLKVQVSLHGIHDEPASSSAVVVTTPFR